MTTTITALTAPGAVGARPTAWIRDGRRMAQREGPAVFDSIQHKHQAEEASFGVVTDGLKASGRKLIEDYQQLERRLEELTFDPVRHLRAVAHGRLDLLWAAALTCLNAVLAVFVLALGAGPMWMTSMLALLVLITAAPVEEFFLAHSERASLREGLFLFLSVLALAASFWLGTLRGLFLLAGQERVVGPASQMLRVAGFVLRYALGLLALVSETLCGYKWFAARHRLCSGMARAARRKNEVADRIVGLHAAIKAAEAEPRIRCQYRNIGARQYLAGVTRGEPHDAHVRRAAVGALIALIVLAALFLLVSSAAAGPMRPRPTVVLLDLTKSSSSNDVRANANAIEDLIYTLPNNGRIVVDGISDAFGRPELLLDRTVTGAGAFGLRLEAARETVAAEWKHVADGLKPTYARTSLLGAIQLLPYVISGGGFDLVIFSDGRENVLVNVDHVRQINVPKVLRDLLRSHAVPALSNVRVWMLGVSPAGKTALYLQSLEAFWTEFFSTAGAHLLAFRVDREFGPTRP